MDINMFSIPLTRYKCSWWKQKRETLLRLLDEQELCQGDEQVLSDYRSSEKYIDTISDILSDELSWFAHDYKCNPIIVRAWYERALPYMYHPTHNHGHGGYSAVLYIEYNPKYHRPTNFIAPFDHFITGEQLVYEPDVEEGHLILFPSFLHHYTHPHQSMERRTVLSFNLTVDQANMPLSWTVNKATQEVDDFPDCIL
jgi:hypothetical protein|tara:strand:+ start:217 stop:810 length:594 start_codon:yes stop_codon:yes gene_type:complete